MKIKDILEALTTLKGADPKLVEALSADADLAKGMMQTGAEKLRPGELVESHFMEGMTNKAPTKEEIKTGPVQEASGGGAERMTGEYSHPVKQMHGVAETPMALAEMLGNLNATMKSGFSTLAHDNATTKALIVALLKADHEDEADEADEEDEEESEVVEINAARGKSLIAQASALIRKAKKADKMAEGEKDEEKCSSHKKSAANFRAKAAKLLAKARTCAYAASCDELKKSIRTIAAKADIDVVQEEEEDEEEEADEEQTKAAPPAPAAEAKAVTDDKGNQADRMNPKNGNQADAAKSEVTAEDLKKCLDGISMLQTTVGGMMNVISGKSKVSDLVPDITKASPAAVESLSTRIYDAEDAGTLSVSEATAARDILGKLELVKGGTLDASIVKDRIAKTTPNVRALFSNLIAA